MAKTCPKCAYQRQESDSAPDYECPKCGIVYAKYESITESKKVAADIKKNLARIYRSSGIKDSHFDQMASFVLHLPDKPLGFYIASTAEKPVRTGFLAITTSRIIFFDKKISPKTTVELGAKGVHAVSWTKGVLLTTLTIGTDVGALGYVVSEADAKHAANLLRSKPNESDSQTEASITSKDHRPDVAPNIRAKHRTTSQASSIVDRRNAEQKKGREGLIGLATLALGVGIVFFVFGGDDGPDNGGAHGAWAYMQIFVEKRLKSPKSADFPFGGYEHVTDLGGGRYQVDSYVDAENSFGANIRTNFHGVIKSVDGGWQLESLAFR